MISCITHKKIDKKKWDDCIAGSSTPLVYAASWFLDIVSPGWDALVWNDYKAVFPLTHNRKYGFSYLRQPFFCQQLGIFSAGEVTASNAEKFFKCIPERFRLTDVNLNTSITVPPPGYEFKKNLNLELPLQKAWTEISAKFSDNTKRNIQKAGNAGLHLVQLTEAESLITMFRKNKEKELKPLPEYAWQMLRQIIAESMQSGLGSVMGRSMQGRQSLCRGIFLSYGKRAIFLFSAMNSSGRESGAMFFLISEFIQRNAGTELVQDFEGSNDENLARFYKGFGSLETHYLSIWKNNLPVPIRFFKKGGV
jgi:hypothetical protein